MNSWDLFFDGSNQSLLIWMCVFHMYLIDLWPRGTICLLIAIMKAFIFNVNLLKRTSVCDYGTWWMNYDDGSREFHHQHHRTSRTAIPLKPLFSITYTVYNLPFSIFFHFPLPLKYHQFNPKRNCSPMIIIKIMTKAYIYSGNFG